MKKEIKEALKDVHEQADEALDDVAEDIQTAKQKFKAFINKPWRTVTMGEAILAGALIVLIVLQAA